MTNIYRAPKSSSLDRHIQIPLESQSGSHGILRPDRSALSSDNDRLNIGALLDTAKEIESMRATRVIVSKLTEIGLLTGDYVKILPEYSHCPVLIGADRQPIPLAEIVEAIDEFVDYDALRAEYPGLSYAQIDGAISFLRKLAQLNDRQIDFDAQEDRELAEDVDLIAALRESINDREMARVLGNDQ